MYNHVAEVSVYVFMQFLLSVFLICSAAMLDMIDISLSLLQILIQCIWIISKR